MLSQSQNTPMSEKPNCAYLACSFSIIAATVASCLPSGSGCEAVSQQNEMAIIGSTPSRFPLPYIRLSSSTLKKASSGSS